MGVNGGVASSARQVLILPVGDMEMGLGVAELLCEAEIDDIDLVTTLSDAHQEVVWFDVTMNKVTRMDVLDPRDLDKG